MSLYRVRIGTNMTEVSINFKELISQLEMDDKLSLVFVEGERDLVFWRKIVPVNERKKIVRYIQ